MYISILLQSLLLLLTLETMMVIQYNKIFKKCKELKKLNLLRSYHLKKQEAFTKDSNEMEEERAPW